MENILAYGKIRVNGSTEEIAKPSILFPLLPTESFPLGSFNRPRRRNTFFIFLVIPDLRYRQTAAAVWKHRAVDHSAHFDAGIGFVVPRLRNRPAEGGYFPNYLDPLRRRGVSRGGTFSNGKRLSPPNCKS
jgi:hypothetical protein